MTPFEFNLPTEQNSIIKVIGVGGGGNNAVNHMFNQGIEGVNFIVCNTDAQALYASPVSNKIQLGPNLTEGLGAGANPEIGMQSCEESIDEIRTVLGKNTKMLFITAGMGGGTGTGAAPVIARLAREMGILTVGIVTIPFTFEGKRRYTHAMEGINKLREQVDTIIIIANDKIRGMYGNLKQSEAFAHANEILATAAKSISETITKPGVINLDFADVKTVMTGGGSALMGCAFAEGEGRADVVVNSALNSPLLSDSKIRGAKNVLVNISYGAEEVRIDEVETIIQYIQEIAHQTEIIYGSSYDENLGSKLMVTIIATGFDSNADVEYSGGKRVTVYEMDGHKTPSASIAKEEKKTEEINNVPEETGRVIYNLEETTPATVTETPNLTDEITETVTENVLNSVQSELSSTIDITDNNTVSDYVTNSILEGEENDFDLFSGIVQDSENAVELELTVSLEPETSKDTLNIEAEKNIVNEGSLNEYHAENGNEEKPVQSEEPFFYYRSKVKNEVSVVEESLEEKDEKRKRKLLEFSVKNLKAKNYDELDKPTYSRLNSLTNNNNQDLKTSLHLSPYSVKDADGEYPNPEVIKDNQFIHTKRD